MLRRCTCRGLFCDGKGEGHEARLALRRAEERHAEEQRRKVASIAKWRRKRDLRLLGVVCATFGHSSTDLTRMEGIDAV